MKRSLAWLLMLGMASSIANAETPVVVELFTSQGCSSCPPADKLLTQLHKEFGDSILPLAYHVDYWNHLGWQDPYSRRQFTERQQAYYFSFQGMKQVATPWYKDPQLYTPQMIVQGDSAFVGSEASRAHAEIEKHRQVRRDAFTFTVQRAHQSQTLTLRFHLEPGLNGFAHHIDVAAYENAPEVEVTRGENAGRTMTGDFAVRLVGEWPSRSSGDYEIPVSLDSSWVPAKTGLAVLVVGEHRKILSAQTHYPLESL
jgi:hypothetical protein